jgi:hypothetical protein
MDSERRVIRYYLGLESAIHGVTQEAYLAITDNLWFSYLVDYEGDKLTIVPEKYMEYLLKYG